ncbi:MAG: hypothetical protein NTV51_11605 [Verrucomicrobia bacterium]|nr:hypothetical protein [Verrucomicrobiota bacterium]
MKTLQWTGGSLFCLFAVWVACTNWAGIFLNARNQRRGIQRHYSQGPVVGPVSAYLGLAILPFEKNLGLWLLPLIDPSTWILLVGGLVLGFRSLKTKTQNRAGS